MWQRASNTPGWQRWSFASIDGGWIDETFVEEARATMDPSVLRQEFEASIESLLAAVYPDFGKRNIAPTRFNPQDRLIGGGDSNSTPFSGCIMPIQSDTLALLLEYTFVDADTETMASAVSRHYPNFEILTCPDPTGRSPQTSSAMGLSDHASLKRRSLL